MDGCLDRISALRFLCGSSECDQVNWGEADIFVERSCSSVEEVVTVSALLLLFVVEDDADDGLVQPPLPMVRCALF